MQIPGGGLNQAAGLAQQRQAAFLGQLLPEQAHPARRGVDEPQQHLHGGGFARAVRPDEPVHAPLRYVQLHMVHGCMRPVLLAQGLCFDYGLHNAHSFAFGMALCYTLRLKRTVRAA